MASKLVWFMRDAVLAVDNIITTVSSSATLESQISATATLTSRVKNCKVELAEMDVDVINVMGLQQLVQENRPKMAVCTFNTVMYPQGSTGGNTTLYDFLFGTGAAVGASGYNRYQGGEKASGARTQMAFLLKSARPTAAVATTSTYLLNNAYVVAGPISADAEGHFEQEWTVKCLATDLYVDTGITADAAT